MATNYRNKLGNHIMFGEWKTLLSDSANNGSKETLITKGEYELVINKRYAGTTGSLFKVSVDCSEDCADFHGYNISFQGDIKAEVDYNRVIDAINNDLPLMQDGKVIEA